MFTGQQVFHRVYKYLLSVRRVERATPATAGGAEESVFLASNRYFHILVGM